MFKQAGEQCATLSGQAVVGLLQYFWYSSFDGGHAFIDHQAKLRHEPADLIALRGALATNFCRARCRLSNDSCAVFFTGTKRILGRATASQIASASAASFYWFSCKL